MIQILQILLAMIAIAVVIAIALLALAIIFSVYSGLFTGKIVSYSVSAISGWALMGSPTVSAISFCTILIVGILPLLMWGFLLFTSTNSPTWSFGTLLAFLFSNATILGYYAAHFRPPTKEFTWTLSYLNSPGIVRIRAREEIWLNALRTQTKLFWGWTVATRLMTFDVWFRSKVDQMFRKIYRR